MKCRTIYLQKHYICRSADLKTLFHRQDVKAQKHIPMKKLIFTLVVFLFFYIPAFSQPVDLVKAQELVVIRLKAAGMDGQYTIRSPEFYQDPAGSGLVFLFHLSPQGYMVVPGKMELPPVLAYSFTNDPDPEGRLVSLVKADLLLRLKYQPETMKERNRQAWETIGENQATSPLFQQWPPAGTTSTGGWLETNWTQDSPYNQLCPMDLVTGVRSIAGCPAVAMAQIVNFHKTIHGVHFTDEDDYYHQYAGRNFMIDDDWATVDFPSFPMLNGYLDTLQISYDNGVPLKNRDKAALTFACGVAATQVYTSSGSGTFGVSQAFEAYQKFNFSDADLLVEADTDLYPRMAQNIKDILPVHLAVVDPSWSTGHNVVVDGYNTNEYFHLNFGWGGASNGWYLLPEGFPYGLTVVEGAIVDINPDFPTGIAEKHLQPELFYPNPASDRLQISAGNAGYSSADLFSPDGRLQLTVNLDQAVTTIDLTGFRNGIYLIRMYGTDGVTSGKLLIRR